MIQGSELPALGNPSSQAMSPAKAQQIGARVVAELRGRNLIANDPQLEDFIRGVGKRLLAHTETNDQNVQYFVIKRDDINSFALPGAKIGIFTGMITATDNESELASVMAHETAHVTQHHISREKQDTAGLGWETMALILAGAIAGASTGNPDAIPAAVSGGMAHMMKQRAGYTRAHEYEADRTGIRTLAAAHFDPHAMVTFFQKLARQQQVYNSNQVLPTYLTHPVPSTRIAEAAERAAALDDGKTHASPVYPLMRERARVLQSDRLDELRADYKTKIAQGEATAANAYGYGLTLIRLGNAAQAIRVLKPYAHDYPGQLPWQLALAKAESANNQPKQALQRLRQASSRFGDKRAVNLAYASALLSADQPGAMREFLLSKGYLLENSPKAQRLLAQGAHLQNRLGEAYFRRAKLFAMQGRYPHAINQIQSALQTADLDDYNESRLKALRKQFARRCNRTYGTDKCREAVRHLADRNSRGD